MTIRLEDIKFSRGGNPILDRLNLSLESGRLIGVVGPNGSGKSTLLRLIYGFLKAQSGVVLLDGRSVETWDPGELAVMMGVCPQEAEASLDFEVDQLLGLRSKDFKEKIQEFPFLKLEELGQKRLSQLSGGERQRVRLGVGLLNSPTWLVLDEPANHLDLATAWSLYTYLSTRSSECGVVIALHNLSVAARFCQELVVLRDGGLVAQGAVKDVLTPDILSEVFSLNAQLVNQGKSCHIAIEGVAR